jgi:stearoyl-CoA desaturase (delta-9 desaturase)
MTLETKDPLETKGSFKLGHARLSVEGENLAKPQRVHAFAILVLPLVGVAAAAWLAVRDGIGAAELISLAVMYSVSWIGITVGYHRHFSHRSFRAHPVVRGMLGIFGSIACQGPINYWVSNHRRHHQYSDKIGDIHSPLLAGDKKLGKVKGFYHSHIAWTFSHPLTNTAVVAKDILACPIAAWVNRNYYIFLTSGFIMPAIMVGLATWSWHGALLGFLWGGAVRLFLCYHSTNTITSLTHMWGRKVYRSHDESRNNIWLAIPTWGESWHNNHHAFPGSAIFGQHWWQVDLGAIFIRILQLFRLVYDVKQTAPQSMRAKLL